LTLYNLAAFHQETSMTSLLAHINSLKFSDQLATVKTLLDSAKVKKTFWGARVVTVNGYTGSVYLEDLAYKIVIASDKRSEANDLQPAERNAGIEIVKKLDRFYEISDQQIRCSNCFTRLLNWLREFTCGYPYTTRFYLEQTAESNFRKQLGGPEWRLQPVG